METTRSGCKTDERAKPSYEELFEENIRLKRLLQAARARVRQLEAQVQKLLREANRQAAPFRKAEGPKANPKKPGRKSGTAHGLHAHRPAIPPSRIDERHDAPLPNRCPRCGGHDIQETGVAQQYQTEIPRRPICREFTIHIGCCASCGGRVQGRHPLQTSDALGAAASQLGPDAHAALVMLNKGLGLSHGKCAKFFSEMFGIQIGRATSVRSMLRTAAKVGLAYDQARQAVKDSNCVVPDETGWREGGRNAWLHVFATPRATCYDIGDRSGEVSKRLLGLDWSGTLVHDGWSVYDQFRKAFHQQCLGHLQRRCQRMLETAVGGAKRLPRQVLVLIDQAFALRRKWRGHRLNVDELAEAGLILSCELERVASGHFTAKPNRRLAKHILKHAMHWFWFLIDPKIDATNYLAEQAIRPAVVNRKVWGGNRAPTGSRAQARLTSVLVTLSQRGWDVLAWLSAARRSAVPLSLPP
jgi:transposase